MVEMGDRGGVVHVRAVCACVCLCVHACLCVSMGEGGGGGGGGRWEGLIVFLIRISINTAKWQLTLNYLSMLFNKLSHKWIL